MGVRLVDVNGDDRTDCVSIDQHGAVHAYLNLGTKAEGPTPTNVGWLD
jgi:hypothetical protein